jgi:hypothetical protein
VQEVGRREDQIARALHSEQRSAEAPPRRP